MHDEACRQRVTDALVDERLESLIGQVKSLRAGADAAGATIHLLPALRPRYRDAGSRAGPVRRPTDQARRQRTDLVARAGG